MSLLTNSWRCSLAALAFWALLGTNPHPAVADDKPAEKAKALTPEREQLYNQLRSIRQKVEQLEKEGKRDDAERLKGEAKALQAKLYPNAPENMSAKDPGARLLRAAAENLKAAGSEQEAQHVRQMVERIEREVRKARPPAPSSGASPAEDAHAKIVQDLRNEVQQMRRELQELREQLKKVKEQADHK